LLVKSVDKRKRNGCQKFCYWFGDAGGREITLVNAAAFAVDLLGMLKRSVYHFDREE